MKKFLNRIRGKQDKYDDNGREIMDSTPQSLPVGFTRPPTLAEQVARLVRSERVREHAESQGLESFDEADDFDDPDDDPHSPYEQDFDLATVESVNKGYVQHPKKGPRHEELLNIVNDKSKLKKVKMEPSTNPGKEEEPKVPPLVKP